MSQSNEHIKKRRLEPEQIHLRSNELQEVLGQPPHWIVRSGLLMLAAFVVVVVAVATFLRYPDTIPAPIQITTTVLPTSVEARASGELAQLFVADGETVTAGLALAVLKNTAQYEAVMQIKDWQSTFSEQLQKGIVGQNVVSSNHQLGELAAPFARLKNAVSAYHEYQQQGFLAQQRQQIEQQLVARQSLATQLRQREALLTADVQLSEELRKTNEALLASGSIAEVEDKQAAKALLRDQLRLAAVQEEQTQLELRNQELQQQSQLLRQQAFTEERQLLETIIANNAACESALATWADRYLLQAPIDGQVAFYRQREIRQQVNEGEEIFVILPQTDSLLAYAQLSASNAGKIQLGQRVRMELADYPAQDFGYVFGTVASKSAIIRDGQYWLTITLPKGLSTKVAGQLPFSQEMIGQAEIIVEELTLFERLFRLARHRYYQWDISE